MTGVMSSRTTCISAPGKVLVAGGYLVLDQKYDGLVLATSSRFYTVVRHATTSAAVPSEQGEEDEARITVTAAQFPAGSSWSYLVSVRLPTEGSTTSNASSSYTGPCISIRQTTSRTSTTAAEKGRNKFIEVTLAKVLQLAWEVKVDRIRRMRGGVEMQVTDEGVDGVDGLRYASEDEWARAGREIIRDIRGLEMGSGLDVFVLADNDFYSQRETLSTLNLPPTLSSLHSLPPFNPLPRPIGETNKTGLGSSAALVTSLTAGLLQHLGVVGLPKTSTPTCSDAEATPTLASSDTAPSVPAETAESAPGAAQEEYDTTDTDTIHALAQLAHCTAQGKVGSGFDVSSAVYGSHVYKRFNPACIAGLMELDYLPVRPLPLCGFPSSSSSLSLTSSLARKAWDHQALPVRLPPGLRLVLADVDAGTDTPSFVGKVLKFGRENPGEKERLYADVEAANKGVRRAVEVLEGLSGREGYERALRLPAGGGEGREDGIGHGAVRKALDVLAESLESVRAALRALGDAAGVPIEPIEQTRLLDASCKIPGVIGGGVPGAGGYDALFVITLDRPETLAALQDLWASWTELQVSPLLAMQSDGGLRVEDVREVRGMGEALARCEGRE